MKVQVPAYSPRVATAGEALVDLIAQADGRLHPCEGGAVFNMTRALGLLGVASLYLNPFSEDRFGQGLASTLRAAGVRLARPQSIPASTSLAVATLDAEGKASFSFYREGVADRQVSAPELIKACRNEPGLQVAATGCLALLTDDQDKYLPWLESERAAGRLVVVDANLRLAVATDVQAYRGSVLKALAQAHLVKVSDEDLLALGFNHADPLQAAHALMQRLPQVRWLALTLGARGAVLMVRNDAGGLRVLGAEREGDFVALAGQERKPVQVADTVGAGDCFLAGLLAALLDCQGVAGAASAGEMAITWMEMQAVLACALSCATLCVMQIGCQPPTRQQLETRLGSFPPDVKPIV